MRSSGMFPPQAPLTSVQMQVLNDFYEGHGPPNEAEKDLLTTTLRADRENIELWCQFPLHEIHSKANQYLLVRAKVYHLRTYLALMRRLDISHKPSRELVAAMMLAEDYGKKDWFHH